MAAAYDAILGLTLGRLRAQFGTSCNGETLGNTAGSQVRDLDPLGQGDQQLGLVEKANRREDPRCLERVRVDLADEHVVRARPSGENLTTAVRHLLQRQFGG
jgi:hypothetical protein